MLGRTGRSEGPPPVTFFICCLYTDMFASCFLLCVVACFALSSSSSSSYSSPDNDSLSLCSTLLLPCFWSISNCAFVIFFGVPVSVRCCE